jgi:cobalt-zinc-cadmium efflux system outer membrane protein
VKKKTAILVFTAAVLGLLAGCRGLSTEGEQAARKQAEQAGEQFRPQGKRPSPESLSTNSTLEDFVEFAMLNQPRVAAAYYDWLGSIEAITTARSLPDPQITFQMDIQNIVTSLMPGVMMNFPGPGKLRASADVAAAQSEARYYEFKAASLDTAYQVRRTFYELHFLDARLRLLRENLSLLADLEKLARAQNEVGKVTLQDILRAQIEQERLSSEVANLEAARPARLATFKAALGLPIESAIPELPRHFHSVAVDSDVQRIADAALTNNFRLQGLSAQVRAADALIISAYRTKRPDFSAGIMADVKMNPVLYRPVGTISLPIWRDKIAAQIAQATQNRAAAGAREEAAELELAAAFAEKAFLLREANRNVQLYEKQLLPMQSESLEVARFGYIGGQIDFFNLTDAQQTLLRFGLAAIDARAQRELLLAEFSLINAGMSPAALPSSAAGMQAAGSMAPPSASASAQTKGMQ